MATKSIVAIFVVICTVSLHPASDWWERAYATYDSSEVSPDGCVRIDTYKPFWLLPTEFHRIPHPDPTIHIGLGRKWELPIFNRAYEVGTSAVLGETIVYDPTYAHDFIYWGDVRTPGRRIVETNGFPLLNSERCADTTTLAKLEAYYAGRQVGE
jgi:hypothetical protein